MKGLSIFSLVTAGLVALTPAPANAYRGTAIAVQPLAVAMGSAGVHDNGRWHRHGRGDWDRGRHRGWDRGRHRGWDRGRHRGWENRRWRWRTVCRTEWRNGYRDRVCRRIRYR